MFAVILTLCTYAACNGYIVDHATTHDDCMTNLVAQSERFADVWHNDKELTKYLSQFNVVEDVTLLTDYDYTCEFIPEAEIP